MSHPGNRGRSRYGASGDTRSSVPGCSVCRHLGYSAELHCMAGIPVAGAKGQEAAGLAAFSAAIAPLREPCGPSALGQTRERLEIRVKRLAAAPPPSLSKPLNFNHIQELSFDIPRWGNALPRPWPSLRLPSGQELLTLQFSGSGCLWDGEESKKAT